MAAHQGAFSNHGSTGRFHWPAVALRQDSTRRGVKQAPQLYMYLQCFVQLPVTTKHMLCTSQLAAVGTLGFARRVKGLQGSKLFSEEQTQIRPGVTRAK
jgi:hypothetical protein